jgi:hypothetical protein
MPVTADRLAGASDASESIQRALVKLAGIIKDVQDRAREAEAIIGATQSELSGM